MGKFQPGNKTTPLTKQDMLETDFKQLSRTTKTTVNLYTLKHIL